MILQIPSDMRRVSKSAELGRSPNLQGRRFGRLVVVGFLHKSPSGMPLWICKCDCGTVKNINGYCLTRETTKSCGCLQREIAFSQAVQHGACLDKSGAEYRLYCVWRSMVDRCKNPRNRGFRNYGGRGITVCERWMEFENFFADMGLPPTQKHSVGRIDNNGGYDPKNCRWETRIEQANNTRTNRIVSFSGITGSVSEVARRFGVDPMIAHFRLRRGWSVERVFGGQK